MLFEGVTIKIYENVNLHVVLYGCGTLSCTLREELRLRVLENRIPRRKSGPKRDEITGDWKNCIIKAS
jgi:hypothetical protein